MAFKRIVFLLSIAAFSLFQITTSAQAAGLGKPKIISERQIKLGNHFITSDPYLPLNYQADMVSALTGSLNNIYSQIGGAKLASLAPKIHLRMANRYNRYVGWHKLNNEWTLVVAASFLLDKEKRFLTEAITQELKRHRQKVKPKAGFKDSRIQVVDGISLVGSQYPDIKNKSFFRNVKRALEMGKKLPPKLRAYIKAVDEIRYNPPSKYFQKSGGIDGAVAYYNRVLSTPGKRIIFIRRKMLYSSPLDTLMSLVHEGNHVVQHETAEQIFYKKRQNKASPKEISYMEAWFRIDRSHAGKKKFVQMFECEATVNEITVARKFNASPKVIESSQYMAVCEEAKQRLVKWKNEKFRRAKKG